MYICVTLNTDSARNAMLLLIGGAPSWCTAVQGWLCVSLSPLSLCSEQLEVTWLSSSLRPSSRCKVLLQFLPRTLQLHLSYTALLSWSSVKSEVLKGPRGMFLSVDSSSEAGHYHRKEMKGLLDIEWTPSLLLCVLFTRQVLSAGHLIGSF